MKERMKKSIILNGSLLAFVLVMFTVQTSHANPVSDQQNNSNLEQSSEVITAIVFLNIMDGKCGEATGTATKKTDAKAKSKTSEGKCGEGKCGTATGKAEKKVEAKGKTETKETTDVKAKTSEGKCGEGKCGEGTSKTEKSTTEKSTSTKAKTSEGKCGEGKCGVA